MQHGSGKRDSASKAPNYYNHPCPFPSRTQLWLDPLPPMFSISIPPHPKQHPHHLQNPADSPSCLTTLPTTHPGHPLHISSPQHGNLPAAIGHLDWVSKQVFSTKPSLRLLDCLDRLQGDLFARGPLRQVRGIENKALGLTGSQNIRTGIRSKKQGRRDLGYSNLRWEQEVGKEANT